MSSRYSGASTASSRPAGAFTSALSSSVPPKPTAPITSYHTYFTKVLAKRLKYVNNIAILLAITASITLNLPYGGFWWNLFLTTARAPVIILALLLIKQSRTKFSTVDISSCKTLGYQIYHSIFSWTYLKNTLFYTLSAVFIHGVFVSQLAIRSQWYLESKVYRSLPLVNDEWVFLVIYSPLFLAAIYSAQHLIFQRNRLVFQYGSQRMGPDQTLLAKLPQLLANALVLSIAVSIVGPLSYWILRSTLYKANFLLLMIFRLDTAVPPARLSFSSWLSLVYQTAHTILLWEIINHAFNVYATIGCLDGKKLISTYSSDPLNTLLTGMSSLDPEHQLSRLSAFQELAYIATTTSDEQGIKLRSSIYSARTKKGYILPAILEECALVIKETSARINYRTASDLKALKSPQTPDQPAESNGADESDIFGNSFVSASGDTPTKSQVKAYQNPTTKSSKSFTDTSAYRLLNSQVFVPVKSVVTTFSTSNPSSVVGSLQKWVAQVQSAWSHYKCKFLSTSIGIFFRITLKRDTGSRVVNPVNFGNAIISVSNLLIHSIEEDKQSLVTNGHIRDVLELFEIPIRATGNYTDFVPASVYLPSQKQTHLIAVLHDLCMHEFFQLCVKFNYKLNDMVLNPRTYKLAKWVIDVAIAHQQQNQQKKTNILLK